MRVTYLAVAAVAFAVHGPATTEGSVRTAQVVTVVARDHSFEAPDTIRSGAVTFRLTDLGPTRHHLIVFRLDDSVSLRDFYERMGPGVVTPAGSSSLGGPESTEEVTIVLRPGRYVLGCLKDFQDRTTHFSRGMFRPGQRVLRIDNVGTQDHHLLIQRLEPGKTVGDVERWIESGRKGPRPVSLPFFGTSRQSRGERLYVAVNLSAGSYLFICRIPDAHDERPHVDHGMLKEVRVQ